MQGLPYTFSQTQEEETGSEEKFYSQNECSREGLEMPHTGSQYCWLRMVSMTNRPECWEVTTMRQRTGETAFHTALQPQLFWQPLARIEHYLGLSKIGEAIFSWQELNPEVPTDMRTKSPW